MALADIIADHESREKRLTVANRDEPEPIVRMRKRIVDAPGVEIRETEPDETGPGNLVLLEDESEPQLAVSTIEEVGTSVLMVNSDLSVTGTRPIQDVETPDVLAGLRYGRGRLHSGFQSISRIDDERGTRRVYEDLAAAGVDVHAYGVDDRLPTLADGIVTHTDDGDELRRSWFVVSTDCPDDRNAALLAQAVGRTSGPGSGRSNRRS